MKLPKIKANLLVQELKDEVLIYDQATNKFYCLNETAKTVFNACDGKKAAADVNLPEDIIYFTLDELKKQHLIEDGYISPYVGMNRREVIRKAGLASMVALPLISGLTAPLAATAQSVAACRVAGDACAFDDFRQSNCCNNLRCYDSGVCNNCSTTNSFIPCTGAGCCTTSGNLCCSGNYTEVPGDSANQRECKCN